MYPLTRPSLLFSILQALAKAIISFLLGVPEEDKPVTDSLKDLCSAAKNEVDRRLKDKAIPESNVLISGCPKR